MFTHTHTCTRMHAGTHTHTLYTHTHTHTHTLYTQTHTHTLPTRLARQVAGQGDIHTYTPYLQDSRGKSPDRVTHTHTHTPPTRLTRQVAGQGDTHTYTYTHEAQYSWIRPKTTFDQKRQPHTYQRTFTKLSNTHVSDWRPDSATKPHHICTPNHPHKTCHTWQYQTAWRHKAQYTRT